MADTPVDARSETVAQLRERLIAGRLVAIRLAPYLASALLRIRERPCTEVGTLAVDRGWRLYWNPDYLRQVATLDRGVELVAGIWLHEVAHLLRGHAERWEALAQPSHLAPLFNVAGDGLINHDLQRERVLLPRGVVHLDQIPSATAKMAVEDVYRLLSADVTAVRGPQSDCGSCAGGDSRDYEAGPDWAAVGQAEAELVRRTVAMDVRDHARRTGSVPGTWARWADDLLEPVVDWRTELASLLRREASTKVGRRDLTFTRPSRRRVPGVVLPASVAAAPLRVACVVDTSGSIGEAELRQALGEVAAIARRVVDPSEGLAVICCDAAAAPPVRVRDARSILAMTLVGGGGTDMRVGIAAAAAVRPTPDVVVVLTDGCTPWPEAPPEEGPRPRCLAVLWGDHPPIGAVPAWIGALAAGPAA